MAITEASVSLRGTVLVVEDENPLRTLMCAMLQRAGFTAHGASNGADALHWLGEEGSPDVIFLDLIMPGMDGPTFVRAARESGVTAPIVIVSASADAPEISEQLGLAGFIQKPFGFDRIVQALDRLIPRN